MSFRFHAAAQQVVLVQVKVENRDQASFPLPVHLSLSLLSCFILSDPSMPASGEVAGLGTALIFCAAGDATGPSFARLSLVDDFFSLEPTGLGSIICHCLPATMLSAATLLSLSAGISARRKSKPCVACWVPKVESNSKLAAGRYK